MKRKLILIAALAALMAPVAASAQGFTYAMSICELERARGMAKFQRVQPLYGALQGPEFDRRAAQFGGAETLRRGREIANARSELTAMIINYVANPGYARCMPEGDSSFYTELRPEIAAEVRRLRAILEAMPRS